MALKRILIFCIFLIINTQVWGQESISQNEKNTHDVAIIFRFDNDLFIKADDYYSNGLYLGFAKTSTSFENNIYPKFLGRWLEHLPGLNSEDRMVNGGFSFAHRMFTPHDLKSFDVIETDMPYSGQFVGNFLASSQSTKHLDAWVLSLGVTGPVTRAEELQFDVHYNLLAPTAKGWDTQLKNEFLANLFYEHRYRVFSLGQKRRYFDLMLNAAGGLGNIESYAEAGLGIRLGVNIPDNFYSPASVFSEQTIGLLPSSHLKSNWSYYVFANLYGSYVAHTIVLDGNIFIDGPALKYDPFWLRANGGFVFAYRKFQVSFALSYLSLSWDNPKNKEGDLYGQLLFGFTF